MTRVQFLNNLYHHLYGMTREQAEQHLTYYAEMLADRMEEGMSEEDAVASLEDVETIARRIMEEEGLPYTPPNQRPITPLAYPAVSRLGGGDGARAYQPPKQVKWWKDWRRITQIALWTIAIIAAIGAVNRWRWNRNVRDDPTESPAFETASKEGWDFGEAPVNEGFEYSEGENYFETSDVKNIDIEWAAGMVWVDSWNGDKICITEYSENELNERTRMKMGVNSETLNIRYRQDGVLGNVKGQKWLNILIPDGMLGEINITTASAEVQVYRVELDTLRIATASGPVTATSCYTQAAYIQTISGEVMCNELHASQAEVSTTSGDVYGEYYSTKTNVSTVSGDIQLDYLEQVEELYLNTVSGDVWANMSNTAARAIGIGSISGNVSLAMPGDSGFTLNYATISGEINVSNFDGDIRGKSGSCVFNGGGCEVTAETTSGDVEIY